MVDDVLANLDASRKWLLAKHVQILVHCLHGFLSVYRCSCANTDSLKTLVLEHLLVVIVECDAVGCESCLSPLELLGVGRESSDELSSWCAVQEVESVTSTHATEACNCDLELAWCHCDDLENRGVQTSGCRETGAQE
jgi:hypothetical protein